MCDQYLMGLAAEAPWHPGAARLRIDTSTSRRGSMQRASEFLVLGLLLAPACSGGAPDDPAGERGSGGRPDASATGGARVDGSGGRAMGSGGLGARGSGGAGGGGDVGTGASGPGSGGHASGSGGLNGTGGSAGSIVGGSGGDAGRTGARDPIIPAVNGDCPQLRTGTETIMGLTTEIVAGTPGATKGPLLFTWHGTGGDGKQALGQLPQSVQQDIIAQGGIVIAPSDNGQVREGTDVTLILGVWYDVGDLKFADQVVACAVQNHNIDPRRIYVTGCSAGGLMAGVMALQRSRYVAAAAPNSGGTVTTTYQLQDPERVPAVFSMHGGTSDTVIVNFADTTHNLEGILQPSGAFLVECNHMMGHCGAPASLHEQAWQFMKAHPFATKPSPYAGGLPDTFASYCAIQP
jgi:predicted esterase